MNLIFIQALAIFVSISISQLHLQAQATVFAVVPTRNRTIQLFAVHRKCARLNHN